MSSTQEKLDQVFFEQLRGKTMTEEQDYILEWASKRLKPALANLIDSAKREVLEQIRPPQATIDSMKLTQPHKYRGVEYPCCSICGYCPEAINAFIDSQLEQSEESE